MRIHHLVGSVTIIWLTYAYTQGWVFVNPPFQSDEPVSMKLTRCAIIYMAQIISEPVSAILVAIFFFTRAILGFMEFGINTREIWYTMELDDLPVETVVHAFR